MAERLRPGQYMTAGQDLRNFGSQLAGLPDAVGQIMGQVSANMAAQQNAMLQANAQQSRARQVSANPGNGRVGPDTSYRYPAVPVADTREMDRAALAQALLADRAGVATGPRRAAETIMPGPAAATELNLPRMMGGEMPTFSPRSVTPSARSGVQTALPRQGVVSRAYDDNAMFDPITGVQIAGGVTGVDPTSTGSFIQDLILSPAQVAQVNAIQRQVAGGGKGVAVAQAPSGVDMTAPTAFPNSVAATRQAPYRPGMEPTQTAPGTNPKFVEDLLLAFAAMPRGQFMDLRSSAPAPAKGLSPTEQMVQRVNEIVQLNAQAQAAAGTPQEQILRDELSQLMAVLAKDPLALRLSAADENG